MSDKLDMSEDWGEPNDGRMLQASDALPENKMQPNSIIIPTPWEIPVKPDRDQPGNEKDLEIITLEDAMADLADLRYELMGHGTPTKDTAESIVRQGLVVGGTARDTDIDTNFIRLDWDYELMKQGLDHWKHNDAKFIAILRVPVKYKLPFLTNSKEQYSAYYHNGTDRVVLASKNLDDDDHGGWEEEDQDSRSNPEGVYEGDYFYGFYDANTGKIHKNPNYHGSLDSSVDVEYVESVYGQIKSSFLETMSEDEIPGWLNAASVYYDYKPEDYI
jgi:hypothetical protein